MPQNYETALVGKEGDRVEIAMTQVPIVVDGEVTGVYGIAKDITERRAAEEELRRAEIRYRSPPLPARTGGPKRLRSCSWT